MAATNFNTENRTYRQLLGNGLTYRVPRFQRDYSWDEEHWEDLWADIQGTLPKTGEPAHYMGYLVLQTADNRTYDVIDGQQRLTTASLIILAAMRLLKNLVREGKRADDNQRRLEQLRATYIGYLDPVSLVQHNKLSLNRNNDSYYRDHLAALSEQLPQRGFPASTHAMRKCFEWFERRLREHTGSDQDTGRALARLVETMSDKLFFTVITVADELNAYKVFETLNARGVRLSATDLLKNYLFSVLARERSRDVEMDELERLWEKLVGRLGSENLTDFLRMHWNSRKDFCRQAELFKAIRNSIKGRKEVFDLLRDMDDDVDTYLALTQPEGSQWPPDWKQCAQELRMFSVRQPYPMLMAAKRRWSAEDFEKLLRYTVILTFRFNIIGSQHTGEQERGYYAVVAKINSGEALSLSDALETLRPIYRNDETFRADFSERSIKTTQSRNAKIVRYILNKLEKQDGGMDFDPESSVYTLEHVLPQSPEAGWEAFSDRDLESMVFRLSNMVMLETGKNKMAGNKPYAEKREILRSSTIRLTRKLAEENGDWNPERLDARQKQLANIATTVWRIAQFS
jgi:hypothetical protein